MNERMQFHHFTLKTAMGGYENICCTRKCFILYAQKRLYDMEYIKVMFHLG